MGKNQLFRIESRPARTLCFLYPQYSISYSCLISIFICTNNLLVYLLVYFYFPNFIISRIFGIKRDGENRKPQLYSPPGSPPPKV